VKNGAEAPRGMNPALQRSANGADVRQQTVKELANPSGGALDTATVLRVFLRRAQLSFAQNLYGIDAADASCGHEASG
jgi:hypothetical protein